MCLREQRRAIAPYAAATACYGRMTSKGRESLFRVRRRPMFGARRSVLISARRAAAWHFGALKPDADGRRRIAVNLRLAEPGAVAQIPIDRFDGFGRFEDLPRDGRCVSDYWF